jgi:DNA-binding IclR family transcriptional regulator
MTIEMDYMPATGPAVEESPSSIAKAVRVLRSLAMAGDSDDGVTHIASLANLPKSTTHRVLSVLIGEGLVSRSEQRYRLGPGWFELQSALSSSEWHRIVHQAKKPLSDLFEETEATVHFGVLDGAQVLYLEKLTALGGTRIPTRVGGRMPAMCTALGKALLAHADPADVRSVLSQPLPFVSRRSITSPRMILNQLAEIRRTGIAREREESQVGVFCIAAPVFRAGKVVAAVSVTRVGNPTTPRDEAAVRRAAAEIGAWIEGDC